MLVVETIAKVRRDHLVDKKPIKAIARDRGLSRNTVRKVIRSGATGLTYERTVQPQPKIGPWKDTLDEMLAAGRGEGCRWNGREAKVSDVETLSDAMVSLTEPGSLDSEHARFWQKLKQRARVVRGYSDCFGHCLVATGRCEVMLDPVMNTWDCAALLPLVEEAGGTFTDWSGARTIYGGNAISTNGALLDPLMELLA